MASPLAKGVFQRAIGESGGLFEPLQLAPKYVLANAQRDGEKYAASLGAASLKDLRRLPATQLTGNAGGIVHPVIEPYLLPLSPYEAFASGLQNDVPLLIGSNADEARAIVDVTHDTAATFNTDLEHSVGKLPPALLAAYPHSNDEEARQAQLGLERDLRFGWDMWAWARLQAGTGKSPSFTTHFDNNRRFRMAPCTRVGARATSPSYGMSSITWTSRPGTGLQQIGSWQRRCPSSGSTSRDRVIQMARAFPRGRRSPLWIARLSIWPIRSPWAALRIFMA